MNRRTRRGNRFFVLVSREVSGSGSYVQGGSYVQVVGSFGTFDAACQVARVLLDPERMHGVRIAYGRSKDTVDTLLARSVALIDDQGGIRDPESREFPA